MPILENVELKLLPPEPVDGEDDDLQYDPHLQEETLRRWAGWGVTPEIYLKSKSTRQKDDELVDVVVKLEEGEATAPAEIEQSHRIGKRIVTGAVAVKNIRRARDEVDSLKAALPAHLHLFNSVPAIRCDRTSLDAAARVNGDRYPDLDGSDVIIGIVDFGCDFRHQNFRNPSGATRLLSIWDQNEAENGSSRAAAGPPKGFFYGRELTAAMIDGALAAGDENAYKVLGYMPPVAAHGTHVMDIAAGNGREPNLFNGQPGNAPPQPSAPGVAPNAQIIFVNLKSFERGFLGNSRCLLEAVAYIFEKADEIGKPAVVNLSLSTIGGPHDGTTLVEQGFEELVTAKSGRAIVTSAGNAFTLQSHIVGVAGKDNARILWNTDPRHDDPQRGIKNEIEIWYPKGDELNVTLYAPGATTPVGSVGLGETVELFNGKERVGRISHRENDPNNHDNQIDIRLPHYDDPGKPWTIELESKVGKGRFHAWIEQSERGLSRFVGDTQPAYTLGSISCGNGTLTVGAFDTAEKAALSLPYEATSAGPIRETAANKEKALRKKPELSAPGVNIVAARARGGVTVLSGTSMAAPHVTGLIALLFQLAHRSGRGVLPFSKTCDILIQGLLLLQSIPRPAPRELDPAKPSNDLRLGGGRIDGPLTVTALLKLVATSIILDLKIAASQTELEKLEGFEDMFRLLEKQAQIVGHNGFTVDSIINFLQGQRANDESFRLTIEYLGEP
ncbi:MAG TPA: S8 family serine peptidase [Thermoanaerobaculia bacterium]|jgi:subtilisin family serine protease